MSFCYRELSCDLDFGVMMSSCEYLSNESLSLEQSIDASKKTDQSDEACAIYTSSSSYEPNQLTAKPDEQGSSEATGHLGARAFGPSGWSHTMDGSEATWALLRQKPPLASQPFGAEGLQGLQGDTILALLQLNKAYAFETEIKQNSVAVVDDDVDEQETETEKYDEVEVGAELPICEKQVEEEDDEDVPKSIEIDTDKKGTGRVRIIGL